MIPDAAANVHVLDLAGGGRAVVKRKSNIPLVTIAIAARGGTHHETPMQAGFTSLVGRTSIKGTETRSAARIAEEAERMGGSIVPTITADLLSWEVTVPARHFERALELLADVVFAPVFRDEEFEIERKLGLADLRQTRDDMYRYPLRLCLQQAFRAHPYGNTIADVERALTDATAADLRSWHAGQVRNAWAFVVGDVDAERAARAIAAVLPAFDRDPAAPATEAAAWQGAALSAEERDKAQTALALAFPGPPRNHADAYAVQVLANAVGGLGGRFFEELRSRRSLAYTVALMPIQRWLGGAFVAYIATAPEREAEARAGLLEQFARLIDEPLPAAEVRRAQRYTIGTWQIRSQTNSAQLSDLVYAYLLGSGITEILEYEQRIAAVTPAAILAVARRYFDARLAVQGIVRGKESLNGG